MLKNSKKWCFFEKV